MYKSVTFDQFDVDAPHVHQKHIFFEIQYHCTGTIICICKILKAE